MKYVIILLVLVCIATVSCKKGPTGPTVTQYAITIDVQGSESINFYGTIFKSGSGTSIDGITPKQWSASLKVPGENLSVIVTKDQASGKLQISFRDQANGKLLASGETSAAFGSIQISFP